MKKIFAAIVIFIFIFQHNISSQGWQWIDTGFPFILFDMNFPSGQSSVGFAVGSNLTFGGDGIILKTTDGGSSWFKISTDTIPGLKAVCFTSVDVGYAAGFQNYFMKTTDGGFSWVFQVIDDKLWFFNNIEFWDANNGIVVSYPSSVYRTTDAGTTWNPSIGIKHSVEDLCYADANTLYLVGGNETIYKSTNGGFIWIQISSGVPLSLFLGVEFYNPSYGIVCGEDGKVLVTTDGGNSWTTSNAGGSGLMHGVNIFNEQNAFIAGTPEQVFKTTDGGITWFSDFSGANTSALYKIKFTENNTGLICGSDGKFLINTDNITPVELTGFTATACENYVRLNWATKTELNNSGFEIYRSTNSDRESETIGFVTGFGTTTEPRSYSFNDETVTTGIYKYRLKQIDFNGTITFSNEIEIEVGFTPQEFVLSQNYPNPFNPVTTIQYNLPVSTNVQLKIYDVLQKEVRTIVDEFQQPGIKSYTWDSKDNGGRIVSTGMYLYKLQTREYLQIKKLMLLK